MGGMDISSRLEFEADPKTVYHMMTDQGWFEELAEVLSAAGAALVGQAEGRGAAI